MLCLGILWNSVIDYKNDVLQDIEKYATIIKCISLDLKEDYEQFVRDIYNQDDIAKWKVDKKIETMFKSTNSRKVLALIMDIETNTSYYHKLKKRMVYTNLEQMKIDIREKYSKYIPYYFFDNVFHVTDDEKEFQLDYKVLQKYNIGKYKIVDEDEKRNSKVKIKKYDIK